MNIADIAIFAIIAISVLIGVMRGFVVEVLSLAVWIAAVALAMIFGAAVAGLFEGSIALPSVRIALGYALVFIATLVAGGVCVYIVGKIVKGTGLSGTDRMLGIVFGLARGALIVVVLVVLMGLTPFPRDAWWQESRALPSFQRLAQELVVWLPESVSRYIRYGLPDPQEPPAPAAEQAA